MWQQPLLALGVGRARSEMAAQTQPTISAVHSCVARTTAAVKLSALSTAEESALEAKIKAKTGLVGSRSLVLTATTLLTQLALLPAWYPSRSFVSLLSSCSRYLAYSLKRAKTISIAGLTSDDRQSQLNGSYGIIYLNNTLNLTNFLNHS